MNSKLILLAIFILIFFSCNKKQEKKFSTANLKAVTWVENGDTSQAFQIAQPIIYDVVVRKHNYDDDWTKQCLDSTNVDALSNLIFDLIYSGKLIPYNYFTDEKMTIKEVKKVEKEFARKRIGKMQFIEDWYFDTQKMQFYKKVKGIMLAYERYRADSTVRSYKAGVKVYFSK